MRSTFISLAGLLLSGILSLALFCHQMALHLLRRFVPPANPNVSLELGHGVGHNRVTRSFACFSFVEKRMVFGFGDNNNNYGRSFNIRSFSDETINSDRVEEVRAVSHARLQGE